MDSDDAITIPDSEDEKIIDNDEIIIIDDDDEPVIVAAVPVKAVKTAAVLPAPPRVVSASHQVYNAHHVSNSGRWSCALCRVEHSKSEGPCCSSLGNDTRGAAAGAGRAARSGGGGAGAGAGGGMRGSISTLSSSVSSSSSETVIPSPAQLYGNRVSEKYGYAVGAGRGCPSLRSLFHRGFEDVEIHERPSTGDARRNLRRSILVTSFGLYPPYNDLSDTNNPLLRLVRDGTAVTVVNHWFPEKDPNRIGPQSGVPAEVCVHGGAHKLRCGIQLIHPPMIQHRVDPRTNVWTVKGLRSTDPMCKHPSIDNGQVAKGWGCVHSKIFLVRFADGTLRVSITSGNFGESEWGGMTETLWTQDFPPLYQENPQPLGGGGGGGSRSGGSGGGGGGGASRKEEKEDDEQEEDLFLVPSLGDFLQNLTYGLQRMTVPQSTIDSFLKDVDFSKALAETVWSMPGFHSRSRNSNEDKTAAGAKRPRDEDLCFKCKKTGHWSSDCPLTKKAAGDGRSSAGGGGGGAGAGSGSSGSGSSSGTGTGPIGAYPGGMTYPPPPPMRPAGPVRASILNMLSAAELDPSFYGNLLSGHIRIRIIRAFQNQAAAALLSALRRVAPTLRLPKETDLLRPAALIAQTSSLGTILEGDARTWIASSNGFPDDNLAKWSSELNLDLLAQFPPPPVKLTAKAAKAAAAAAMATGAGGGGGGTKADLPSTSRPAAFALVWPSRETALSTIIPELNANCCFNTQLVAAPRKPAFPRSTLHHFSPPVNWPQRAGLVPHAKTWLPWPISSTSSAAAVGDKLTLFRQWAFVTSHNTSVAALGSKDNAAGGPIRISNWETGALLPPVYHLRLPKSLARIVKAAIAAGDAAAPPAHATPAQIALWEALGCFNLLGSKPVTFAVPFRVPPLPYSLSDFPWETPNPGTPDAERVAAAWQRAIEMRAWERSG